MTIQDFRNLGLRAGDFITILYNQAEISRDEIFQRFSPGIKPRELYPHGSGSMKEIPAMVIVQDIKTGETQGIIFDQICSITKVEHLNVCA